MPLAPTQIKSLIINLVVEICSGDDLIEETDITLDSHLVADLNFSSMDFIELVVAIEDELQQKLGFHDLLMRGGKYVEDLTVEELVSFVESKLNTIPVQETPESSPKLPQPTSTATIKPAQIAQFRQAVETKIRQLFPSFTDRGLQAETASPKNPRVIFILCPPRSGSTLLRVILAGHPQLFAPPELHLLSYPNLAQRKTSLSNDWNIHLLQGTIRALMQIKGCSVEQAQPMMEAYEKQQLTAKQFYHLLQEWIGDRILVEKTPTYAAHLAILQQAELIFEEPLYIHLVRHPYAMIRSYEDAKLDRIVPFLNESSFSRRQLAELTWLVSNQNILEFLSAIPQPRKFQLKFEDLVSNPQQQVDRLCHFMGIEFQTEMLEPYQEKEQRMTDGVESVSQMSGDLKFHLHQGIEANVAFRWKKYHTHDFLSESTWQIAERFGYTACE